MRKKFSPTWESVRTHEIPQWYDDYKLGIFIHWGLYSVPAFATPTVELGEAEDEEWFCQNPYAEWYYNSLKMGEGPTYDYHIEKYGKNFKYEDFRDLWKAENFRPEQWAKLFKQAGAKYVVMVTKHHDGFCLFPSKHTDYNSVNYGPKRDLVGDLTEAVRAEDMKMGLYYSGIIDWRYADDPIYTDADVKQNCCPTYEYADYAYKQSLELIDNYKPSVFWNDIGWPEAGERQLPYLLSYYYNNCEDGVVDGRFNGLFKDFSTKEYKHGSVSREEKWEMCRGLGLSFGYNAVEDDSHIISVEKLISLLVSTVANNGNLLINVGPKADGTIPENQSSRLEGLGEWIAKNGEAIYGTRCSRRLSIETSAADIHFTAKDSDLYVILDNLKEGDTDVFVHDLQGEPVLLDKGVKLEWKNRDSGIELNIRGHKTADAAVVLKFPGGEK
ncbi:MAG: alpha-L-fucosidase [Spirochaetales bacterium]|nr:alpha-L-fucosidase [Spirochaetales bacterium]